MRMIYKSLTLIFIYILAYFCCVNATPCATASPRYLDIMCSKDSAYAIWLGKKYKCIIGKNGVVKGEERRENTKTTPSGTYSIIKIMYRPDRLRFPESSLDIPIQPLVRSSRWCRQTDSALYNCYIDKRQHPALASSPLYIDQPWFDIVAVINYNTPGGYVGNKFVERPIVGKGLGIFLHVRKDNYEPSMGCVHFEKSDLIEILSTFRPTDQVRINIRSQSMEQSKKTEEKSENRKQGRKKAAQMQKSRVAKALKENISKRKSQKLARN